MASTPLTCTRERDETGGDTTSGRGCVTNETTNRVSPISKVPWEIFVLIFEMMCLEEEEPSHHRELVLSHVSSYWRKIAIATPSLRCLIDLQYGHASTLERLEADLQRSQNFMLVISVTCTEFYSNQERAASSLLRLQSRRWEVLRIRGLYRSDVLEYLRNFAHVQTPLLQTLRIELDWDKPRIDLGEFIHPDQPSNASVELFKGECPSLKRVEIFYTGLLPSQSLGPLRNLTTLWLNFTKYVKPPMPLSDLADLLSTAQSLDTALLTWCEHQGRPHRSNGANHQFALP